MCQTIESVLKNIKIKQWVGDMARLPDQKRDTDKEETPRRGEYRRRSGIAKLLSLMMLLLGLTMLFFIVTVPLSAKGQIILFGFLFVLALMLRKVSGRLVTLMLVWLSIMVSCRYMYWRLTESIGFESNIDMLLGLGLLAAEIYTFITLLLGYFQTAWPLKRQPANLPDDEKYWPTVDVYIPTYNEPLKVVKPAIIGAMNMDWPKDKIKVYVLDDGRRDEFREFAEEMGVNYITRPDNTNAKAGNINHAMSKTDGELIAIFDCDHVSVRSFLKTTVGWFLKDEKLAVVQTPHHFYSPDPFERNLDIFRKVPSEGELFYGLIQDGNDLWNASFFCGSCAVIRRTALEEVGGIATESVTEDAFTALKLHRLGYHSAYIARKQAAGLATESLSVHIGQRVRWARGMAQILRLDCPLLGRGLSWGQRLCYSNAMLHFFYGLPRMVFLTAPLAFMFFEAHIIQASAVMIAAYVLPFLFINYVVNSRMQGNHRHSFWAEVYETTVSWYAITPTLLALINPKLGKFNVTAKGGLVEDSFFDMKIAIPYLILLLLNIAGLILGVVRLLWWNTEEINTVILNMGWITYNLIILGAVVAVAKEKMQKRNHARIPHDLHAVMCLPEGYSVPCRTLDLSEGGGAFELSERCFMEKNAHVEISFMANEHKVSLPATLVRLHGKKARVSFEKLTNEQENVLTQMIFTRDDAWSEWSECYEQDKPLRSLVEVLSHGLKVLVRFISPIHLARGAQFALNTSGRGLGVGIFLGFITLLIVLFAYAPRANAAVGPSGYAVEALSIGELSGQRSLRLTAYDEAQGVPFSIRLDEVVTSAELLLAYSHSKNLPAEPLFLNVLVNGQVVESLPLKRMTASGAEEVIEINPFLLSDYNTLSFQIVGSHDECTAQPESNVTALISQRSMLSMKQRRLKLPNELGRLPLPFFDPRDHDRVDVAFAFSEAPGQEVLEAAGAVSSWLGALAAYRGAEFSAYLGDRPEGNSVVMATLTDKPYWLTLPMIEGPSLRLINHPDDPYSKMLLVLGRNSEELKIAAHTLVSGENPFAGDYGVVENGVLAPKRKPYDAPNWLSTNRPVHTGGMQNLSFMLPPDLFLWRSGGIPLELVYRYTPRAVDDPSELQVNFNDIYIDSFSLGAEPSEGFSATEQLLEPVEKRVRLYLPTQGIGAYNRIELYLNDRLASHRDAASPCGVGYATSGGGGEFKVDGGFTVDLSDFYHYTTLPNLAKFANHGFPFTRYSDLSETAIVMPAYLSETSVSTYLTLVGHLGSVAGGVATGVNVINSDQVDEYADYDLLVLGGEREQPLLSRWRSALPFDMGEPAKILERVNEVDELRGRYLGSRKWSNHQEAFRLLSDDKASELSILTAFESPLMEKRSVVVITSYKNGRYAEVVEALLEPKMLSGLQGDLSLLAEDRVSSFRLGERYAVGDLPRLTQLYWYVSSRPVLLFVLMCFGIAVLGLHSYTSLKRRAEMRLSTDNA